MVCFKYISVNSLYKGGNKDKDGNDDDDDDNNNNNNNNALRDMVSQWHNDKKSSYPLKYVFIMQYVKSHKRFGNEICFLLQMKGQGDTCSIGSYRKCGFL